MKTRLYALAAIVALGLGLGCGASVHSSVAPNANLGQYHTYAFATPRYRANRPETPAEQDLREALRSSLAQKGLVEAPAGAAPDFLVAYHVKTRQQMDAATLGYGWYGPADVYTYTEGTLIVDFVDPRTNAAFWRGTASDVVNHPEAPDVARLDKAVAKLINQYPAAMAAAPRTTM